MTQTCLPEERLTLRFDGCLDTARCAAIESDVRGALRDAGVPVVFDLADATFVSSSFLRLCVCALKQAGENRFQIVNVAPAIKRVFKIAGLDCMLKND
jgi:anti-anti-sigma factor